jgi:type I restriction enzyme, S subunit
MRNSSEDIPRDTPNIPPDWQWRSLASIVKEDRGISYGVVQPGDFDASGVPILRADNVRDGYVQPTNVLRVSRRIESKYSRTRLQGGEVLLTLVGAYFGKAAVAPTEYRGWNVARAVAVIPVVCEIEPEWVAFCLRSPMIQKYVQNWATTTAQPTLNLRDVARLPIPVPPQKERRRVVEFLSALDRNQAINDATNATIEKIGRAVFESWFVNFDPVRVNSEEQLGHKASLFPQRLVPSELGEIPEGWIVRSLNSVAELEKGLSYKGQFLSKSGIPMVNLGCFAGNGHFLRDAFKCYVGEYKDRHIVRGGDLVIANTDITQKRDVLGSPALLPGPCSSSYLFTHHVYAIRFKADKKYWAPYVYNALLRPEFRERAIGYATGTTVLALPRDAVLEHRILDPGNTILGAFAELLEPLLQLMGHNSDQNRTLVAARGALLPKLISGELRIDKADKDLSEALA